MASLDSGWYSAWRNDHYIIDLDEVLEILKKQDRPNSIESALRLWPDISGFDVISSNQPVFDSPTPWSSTSDGARNLNCSPTSAMSWTSTDSSERPKFGTRTPSLTTLSQASISPSSLGPETPTSPFASCRECSRDFAGSPQDARSNLQRHLRTSPRHNKNAGLKCPLPECRMRRPMRSDNLGPHLQKFHKMSSSSDRQIVIDESKFSAGRVDSNGIARRRSRLE